MPPSPIGPELCTRLLEERRETWDAPIEVLAIINQALGDSAYLPMNTYFPWKHPAEFMDSARKALEQIHLPQWSSAIGLAVVYEAYAPPAHMAREIYRRQQRGGSVPRFKDIPGRQEAKMAQAIDRQGQFYSANLDRETGKITVMKEGAVQGRVVDSLRSLMGAINASRTSGPRN